jgi:putative ABC transport system permease protein
LKGDIFPVNVDLKLVGIYDSLFHDDVLFFRFDYLRDLMPERRRNKVFAFQLLVDSPDSMPRVCKAVDEIFRNSTARTRTEAERAFELGFVAMLGNVKGFLLSISLALMFTLLLVTANTMAMSVRERVREVGVLKTLGFTTPAILAILLGESALLTSLGGLIGCCITGLLVLLVRRLPAIILPLSALQLEPSVAGLLLAIGVGVGLASALIHWEDSFAISDLTRSRSAGSARRFNSASRPPSRTHGGRHASRPFDARSHGYTLAATSTPAERASSSFSRISGIRPKFGR